MKNVVFVSTELGMGGAEKALTEIALRMPALGFMPTIVSLKPRPSPGRDALVSKLEQSSLNVRFLDASKAVQFLGAISNLRRVFQEKNAVLALSFLHHANVVTAFAVGRNDKVRHLAGIRVAEPSRWRNRLEAWALGRCDEVICVSEGVKGNFARYFRDESRLTVIPNGVVGWQECAPADLSTIGISKDDRVILFVGRLHPQKGLDWALPFVSKVLEQASTCHFVVLGDGPQTEQLERLALNLPAHERIHFLGFQGDLAAFFARAHCLLLPSRWEGMPNVVLEAMAAGLPVLASHESLAGEILHSPTQSPAQLFAFGNGAELVEKLLRLVLEANTAKQLGAENREKSKPFSWDVIAEQYARRFEAMT